MTENNPKEILKANAFFLKSNMVPTDEFWRLLALERVLPDTMIKEAQALRTTQEQNEKLLELLGVRGKTVMLKFCDVLQITNQNYLAQFLREELSDEKQQTMGVDAETLLKRYPRLEKQLDKQDRQQIANIIQEKAKELTLKKDWAGDITDKDRAMEARQRHLEEHFKFSEILKEKDATIKEMGETLEFAVKDAQSKGVSLRHVSNYINDLKKKHKNDIGVQMQYNVANDNSIRRQQERHGEMEETFRDMNNDILRYLKADEKSRVSSASSSEHERVITTGDKAKFNLTKLLTRFQELGEMEKAYVKLNDDAFYVLTHTGRDVKSDLRAAFQGFVVDNEEMAMSMRNEIVTLRSELENRPTQNHDNSEDQNDMIQDLEQLLQKVRAESHAKDEKMKSLRTENERLRQTIAKLEKQLSKEANKRPSTPRFQDFSEKDSDNSTKIDVEVTSLGKTNSFKPARRHPHHHNGPSSKYTLPAIKGAQSSQGTIQFHKSSEHLQGLAPTAISRDVMVSPSRGPVRLSSDTAMIIQQVGMPKKSLGTLKMAHGTDHSVQVHKKTTGSYYR